MPRDSTPRRERMVLVVRRRGKDSSKEILEFELFSRGRVRRNKYMGLLALSIVLFIFVLGVCSWPSIRNLLQQSDEFHKEVQDLDAFEFSELLERIFGRNRN